MSEVFRSFKTLIGASRLTYTNILCRKVTPAARNNARLIFNFSFLLSNM